MWTRKHLRMSWWNALFTLILLLAAGAFAFVGQWVQAVVVAVLAMFIAGSAIYARSGRASDVTRLNALETVDERDRTMTAFALAVVGVAAIFASFGVLLAAIALLDAQHPMFWIIMGQMLALAITWMIANVVAVRRG